MSHTFSRHFFTYKPIPIFCLSFTSPKHLSSISVLEFTKRLDWQLVYWLHDVMAKRMTVNTSLTYNIANVISSSRSKTLLISWFCQWCDHRLFCLRDVAQPKEQWVIHYHTTSFVMILWHVTFVFSRLLNATLVCRPQHECIVAKQLKLKSAVLSKRGYVKFGYAVANPSVVVVCRL